MKKVFSVLLLVLLISAAVWAQPTGPTAPAGPSGHTSGYTLDDTQALSFQVSIFSPVVAASQYYTTEVDLYMHPNYWKYVPFDTTFFFLGGNANLVASGGSSGTASDSIQGGFAAKAFGGVIAAYYHGGFSDGGGTNNGADDSDLSQIDTELTWSDQFALMYASEAIGAIRLDVLLPTDKTLTHEQGENAGAPNAKQYFTPGTTIGLEWGNVLGPVNARFALGFKFPDYTKNEYVGSGSPAGDKTAEKWEGTTLALRAIADWKDFRGETTFTFDFGNSNKGDLAVKDYTFSETGYFHNATNFYYVKTMQFAESFSIKVRPALKFQFYAKETKTKMDYDGYAGETDYITTAAPVFEFQFNPEVQIGAQYIYKKVSLYAGTKATLFTINTHSESKWTDASDTEHKDTPSQWLFQRLSWANPSLNLAAAINFNEKIGLEMGCYIPFLSIGMPGSDGATFISNPFDTSTGNPLFASGNLLVKFKL
jgi:hypothetical protein